jgi:hypothetical protein
MLVNIKDLPIDGGGELSAVKRVEPNEPELFELAKLFSVYSYINEF